MEADTLKLLARAVQPVDAVLGEAGGGGGMRIHIVESAAINHVQRLFERLRGDRAVKGRGEVMFCVTDIATGHEIDIALPGTWPVNPQVMGAIKAIEGVSLVEDG